METCKEIEDELSSIEDSIKKLKILSGHKLCLYDLEIATSNVYSEYEELSKKFCKKDTQKGNIQ